jgi:hypothetical protein
MVPRQTGISIRDASAVDPMRQQGIAVHEMRRHRIGVVRLVLFHHRCKLEGISLQVYLSVGREKTARVHQPLKVEEKCRKSQPQHQEQEEMVRVLLRKITRKCTRLVLSCQSLFR